MRGAQQINVIHDLAAGKDNSRQIDAILLDFCEAFTKVSHQRLLHNHYYDVQTSALRWIHSFFEDCI
jgi:hypothetical protein